jgi:hypothetical protein
VKMMERTAGNRRQLDPEGEAGLTVIETSRHDSFLVDRRGTGLFRAHKASADPDSGGAKGQRCSQTPTIDNATSGHDLDRLARQGALVLLANVDAGGDLEEMSDKANVKATYQDKGGHVAGMSATLSTLAADQVDAHRDGFLAVLRMSYVPPQDQLRSFCLRATHHVHHDDACLV